MTTMPKKVQQTNHQSPILTNYEVHVIPTTKKNKMPVNPTKPTTSTNQHHKISKIKPWTPQVWKPAYLVLAHIAAHYFDSLGYNYISGYSYHTHKTEVPHNLADLHRPCHNSWLVQLCNEWDFKNRELLPLSRKITLTFIAIKPDPFSPKISNKGTCDQEGSVKFLCRNHFPNIISRCTITMVLRNQLLYLKFWGESNQLHFV